MNASSPFSFSSPSRLRLCILAAFAALVAGPAPAALADSGHQHGASIGKPGKASDADRTVEVVLRDTEYQPRSIEVKAGETVRFVLRNEGQLLHDFSIGTPEMQAAHQKEMMMMMDHGMITATGINEEMMNMDHSKMGMPEMKHDDPNAVMVEPGKTKELVWTFPDAGNLEFACNMPGHYDLGMVGKFKIAPAR